jgi:hypothetical protein
MDPNEVKEIGFRISALELAEKVTSQATQLKLGVKDLMCALEHWQNCQNLEVKGGERVKFFNYHLW